VYSIVANINKLSRLNCILANFIKQEPFIEHSHCFVTVLSAGIRSFLIKWVKTAVAVATRASFVDAGMTEAHQQQQQQQHFSLIDDVLQLIDL